MSAEHVRWYAAKVDWWLVPVLSAPPVAAVAVCVGFALTGSTLELLVGAAVALAVAALYAGLLIPMRYGLGDTCLVVRFGRFRRRIPLADISEVVPTSNPLSSPALSLDRLRIRFGRGVLESVMISPADHDLFLDDLARNSGLRRAGDRLFRG